MTRIHLQFLVATILVVIPVANAQQRGENPFYAYDCAQKIGEKEQTNKIVQFIRAAVSGGVIPSLKDSCASELAGGRTSETNRANWFLLVAELMKRVGDYEASVYYENAIEADGNEAAYRLFYGDYLRNFRGPQRPLFPEAEEQY